MLNKLVIASGNAGKLAEIQALLAKLNIEVMPQSAFSVTEAPEPHMTFIENALAKARHASLPRGEGGSKRVTASWLRPHLHAGTAHADGAPARHPAQRDCSRSPQTGDRFLRVRGQRSTPRARYRTRCSARSVC